MYINKRLRATILSSVMSVGLVFVPTICPANIVDGLPLPVMSVANAELQKYTGVGESIISDRETLEIGKQGAKMQAIRNAQEQAGVFLSSQTVVKNARMQSDEIMAFTASVVHIDEPNIKYELIPLNDALGTAKYRATVIVTIDTDELNDKINKWLERDSQQRANLVDQNNELQRIIDEQAKRIAQLEQTIANSSGTQNKVEIQNEIAAISNETLYVQRLEEGDKLAANGDYNGAIAKYNEAISINSNSAKAYAEAYNRRGLAYRHMQNYKAALSDCTRAIQLNPKYALAYYNRGIVYRYLKNYDVSSIADLSRYIQLEPNDPDGYNARGLSYAALKNYNAAINDYNKTLQLDPNYSLAYYYRGITYRNLQNYDMSVADLTKYIQLEPNDPDGYHARGLTYYDVNKYNEALADYTKTIQMDSNYAVAYYNRGLIYKDFGQYNEAITDFSNYIRLVPNDKDGYEQRAACYRAIGDDVNAQIDTNKYNQL